jgi:superfamily II DNA or RNA helicase
MDISPEQLRLYMSLFRGRNDIYARRWEKDGKSGYSPAYEFNWQEFMAFKAKGGSMRDFPNKKLLPLKEDTLRKHVAGQHFMGIYPLLDDNTSHFIAADFDGERWKEEIGAFLMICEKYSIPAYPERSRSGNGAHAWIFFESPHPAFKSRKIVLELVRQALNFSEFDKEISFDRLFPSQDYHSKEGFGNLIALPLNGSLVAIGNTAFVDSDTLQPVGNQWEFLKGIKRLSPAELNQLYGTLVGNEEGSQNTVPSPLLIAEPGVLHIFLKNQIHLNRSELNGKIVRHLRENLNYLNTEYLIKKKIGISTYKTEKYFKAIEESGDRVMIPRGFVRDLVGFCQENKFPFQLVDERKLIKKTVFKSKIALYDYQEDALAATEGKDFGVIVSPPGAGKTIMGLELIARKEQPALILVHRKQLFDQWIDRIQSFLGIPKKDIGQIHGAKRKIGQKITVGMMQSLVRMEDAEALKNSFGTIIVDECHHIPAKTFREAITKLDSYYLYGLTATPKRKHNDEKLIFVYIGNILAEVDRQFKPDEETLPPQVRLRETSLALPFDYRMDDLQLLSKVLVYDSARNDMIAEDILRQVQEGRKILVLTERKEHVEILSLYLKGKAEIITITGDDSAASKKSKMGQIKMGHFQVLISTGQFFGEGMDIDSLDCLFLVYPFSFEGKLIQYIGRIQRSKSQQTIFDYRDKNIDYCEKLFKKRNRYYRKMNKV